MCTGVCLPGSNRYCDDPTYCFWGKQTCTANGQWGACIETGQPPAGCGGPSYDQNCCVQAGQCCEDLGSVTLVNGQLTTKSIGNCNLVTTGCKM
jgi:hypothetical protein